MAAATIQTNIKQHTGERLNDYALFLGGMNVTHDVLMNYDPLRTGYGRLFMVRKPLFLVQGEGEISEKFNKFKHIIEYGNTAVQGINDISLQTNTITGGYTGRSFELPSVATDDTNQFSVTCYEFSGSPIREVIHSWINGMSDLLTGLAHLNGAATYQGGNSNSIDALQANETAEFIYVATDNTGQRVEYACMFANCFPKNIHLDQFNYQSGSHELVEYTIEFSCVKYESLHINALAKQLLNRYRVLANSLNFYAGSFSVDEAKGYNIESGKMEPYSAVQNNKVGVDTTVYYSDDMDANQFPNVNSWGGGDLMGHDDGTINLSGLKGRTRSR